MDNPKDKKKSSDKAATPTNKEGSDMTPAEQKQFEEWKAFAKGVKLSKNDEATLELATSTLIDAVMNNLTRSLTILYGLYMRNYKFIDAGCLERADIGLSEVRKNPKNVGKYSLKAMKDKLEFDFSHYYYGCEIKISFKNKLKIFG